MTGSLQHSHGKFYAVINLRDENGNTKQKWVNLDIPYIPGNKQQAKKAFRDVLVEYEGKRITVFRKDILFCDFVLTWLEEARDNLQFNTYEAYKNTIDKHIIPYFKAQGVSLMSVAYPDIKAYYNAKAKTLSGKTLKKHHAIIRQVLKKAVQEGLITSNPSSEITLPKAKPFTGSFLTVEQGNKPLETVNETPLEPIVILAMMYGLRRSELAGLKWSAVDFQNDTLTIRHTVTQYKTRVAKDETKNKASHRTLLSLNVFESFLRNNGRVVVLIKITAFHAVIPNLLTVLCHCFLEQSASDLFFVGNEFVDGLTIPLRFSGWRGDTLRRQTSRNLAKTVAGEVSLENPEDDFGFGFIDAKTAVIRFAVSVTGAVGHFGSTIPEAFADTAFDGEFF